MTYRERRERKAERLRGYAEAREAKQPQLWAAADPTEAGTGIPFGQPILVGHHSERRHRNAIAKVDRAMRVAVENSRKAESMSARADEIDRQADVAIYDDDPDAIERLEERIAKLEAERDRRKAANAAYRKAHRDELKAMGTYDRSQAVPFPSYSLSNLGGRISTDRKRMARIAAQRANPKAVYRIIESSRRDDECSHCGAVLPAGSRIRYARSTGAMCVECPNV